MKKLFSIIMINSMIFLFLGCSVHPVDPVIDMKPPKYVEQIPPRINNKILNNEGSLFGKGDNPLFSDRTAMHINDIVTVVINENIAQSSTGKKKLQKNNNNQLGGGLMTPNSGGIASSIANTINSAANIGFKSNSSNIFSSSGVNTRNEKFTTTITARVIKILGNGNYFIAGSRELLVNGNKQIIKLSGVIRPYDIDQKNTIDSKYIADAKILYQTEGDIDASTTKPWGAKFIEAVSPF